MERTKTSDKAAPRLGRGLSALIPPQGLSLGAAVVPRPAPPDAPPAAGVQEIALADIQANEWQPRTQFDAAAIDELAASIKAHGVLQPVMVRPHDNGRYELVAGERRFRASERAGLKTIPAVVRSLTNEESLTVALIENIQREDLNPMEAARGYKQLVEEFGLTQTQLGQQIGKKQSTISNTMRLLTLAGGIQDSISDGRITEAHGRALLLVKDERKRQRLWRQVIEQGYSVKRTEEQAEIINGEVGPPRRVGPESSPRDVHWSHLADRLRQALMMKVALKPGKGRGGTLLIEFADVEALEGVLDRLQHST